MKKTTNKQAVTEGKGDNFSRKSPRILVLDIESSPILGWTYRLYDTTIIRKEKDQTIMSMSWKWYKKSKVYHESIQAQSEKELLIKIRDLLSEADWVIGHNSVKFDIKMLQAGFLRYGIAPPSPFKNIDTLTAARSIGKFSSNKLTDLGALFGIGTKTETTYASLWYDALIHNDAKSWRLMRIYNNQDVILTEKLYEVFKPFMKNHPVWGDVTETSATCPKCGSDTLQRRGFTVTRAGRKQRYQCQTCSGWSSEANIRKEGRLVNA